MNIAQREAKETVNWLQIIKKAKVSNENIDPLAQEGTEIGRILVSIVKTSQLGPKI